MLRCGMGRQVLEPLKALVMEQLKAPVIDY
jgi:hypothetical protein